MKRRIVVRPEGRIELAEAAAWYRSKSEVVAEGFRAAVRQTIAHIVERPGSFTEILPGVHRALTSQFPYAIFYAEENDSIGPSRHQAPGARPGGLAARRLTGALHRTPARSLLPCGSYTSERAVGAGERQIRWAAVE